MHECFKAKEAELGDNVAKATFLIIGDTPQGLIVGYPNQMPHFI
jgi:hypothetical protein